MFGLPMETTLLLLGFPFLWIVYTIVFLVRTRHWADDETRGDDAS